MPTITHIALDRHPKLGDLEITIPEVCRHLVLTGPNGSGKTLALTAIAAEMNSGFQRTNAAIRLDGRAPDALYVRLVGTEEKTLLPEQRREAEELLAQPGARLLIGDGRVPDPGLCAFIDARRTFVARQTGRPPASADSAGPTDFYDWLRHQYLQRLLARASEDTESAERLDRWLESFEERLRTALGLPDLQVLFSPKTYELQFAENGAGPYSLDSLALGHASILAILAEIVLRMDTDLWLASPAEITGLVLIDEPEMHLHPELQERIMPFLTQTFPGLQFILATHSPAVAANTPDALVYDLERREGTPSEALRGIDYGDLAVGHFGIATPFDLETSEQIVKLKALAEVGARGSAEYTELLRELRGVDHPVVLEELLRQDAP